jgi:CheY-like chemotaxis protein
MRLLIVEDEWIIAYDLRQFLESLGHTVHDITDNAEDAVKLTEKFLPDTIFMDIKLKGDKTGLEAADVIYKKFKTQVIFCTAFTDEDTRNEAKLVHPIAYISKPYSQRYIESILKGVNRIN